MTKKERVSVYIDGFNLYFGIRIKYPTLKWLNVEALSNNLLKSNQELASLLISQPEYETILIKNEDSQSI